MNRRLVQCFAFMMVIALLLLAPMAFADSLGLTILAPSSLNSTANVDYSATTSYQLNFTGTLTNNTSSTLYVNSDSVTFDIASVNAGIVLDDGPFYSNPAFYSLAPNATVSGSLFTVTVPKGTPTPAPTTSVPYTWSFAIVGGPIAWDDPTYDSSTDSELAMALSGVTVHPARATASEPSGLLLLGTGVVGLLGVIRKKLG